MAEGLSILTSVISFEQDAKHGTSTGVSAADRCQTIKALASPDSIREDFVTPGHIFPIKYREGEEGSKL